MEVGSPSRAALERAVHVKGDLRGKVLLGLAAEEEHAVLLARMRHVVELARRPRSLEVRYSCETGDAARRQVHQDIDLGGVLRCVLLKVLGCDHRLAIARAQLLEQDLPLPLEPQRLLADELVVRLLGHHLVLPVAAHGEQGAKRRAQLDGAARERDVEPHRTCRPLALRQEGVHQLIC